MSFKELIQEITSLGVLNLFVFGIYSGVLITLLLLSRGYKPKTIRLGPAEFNPPPPVPGTPPPGGQAATTPVLVKILLVGWLIIGVLLGLLIKCDGKDGDKKGTVTPGSVSTVIPSITSAAETSTPIPTKPILELPTTAVPEVTPRQESRSQYEEKEIAFFVGDQTKGYELVLLNVETGARKMLVTVEDICSSGPTWSPDGRQIVYAAPAIILSPKAYSGEPKEYCQLFRLSVETGQVDRITDSPRGKYQPSWSPDGRYIAFTSKRPWSDDMDLWIYDLVENNEIQLTFFEERSYEGEIWGPKWSPDGKTIAFWSDIIRGEESYEIFLLPFSPDSYLQAPFDEITRWSYEQGLNSQIVNGVPMAYEPEQLVWSPDGSRFAFIWKADPDSSMGFDVCYGRFLSGSPHWIVKPGSLTCIPDEYGIKEAGPDWSPDGSKIAFHRAEGHDSDIVIFDLKTGTEKNLTSSPYIVEQWPAWRPRVR